MQTKTEKIISLSAKRHVDPTRFSFRKTNWYVCYKLANLVTRKIGIRNGNGGVIGQFGKGLGGIVTFITHFKKKKL